MILVTRRMPHALIMVDPQSIGATNAIIASIFHLHEPTWSQHLLRTWIHLASTLLFVWNWLPDIADPRPTAFQLRLFANCKEN